MRPVCFDPSGLVAHLLLVGVFVNLLSIMFCSLETAMDEDADKAATDSVRLRVTIGDHDYDIRSEADASIEDDDKIRESKLAAESASADAAAETAVEGAFFAKIFEGKFPSFCRIACGHKFIDVFAPARCSHPLKLLVSPGRHTLKISST